MNYCGLNLCDTANGSGVRVSLFVSGCTIHCKGCFNPESWDFNYGQVFTDETKQKILATIIQPYCAGLSVLGGDPLEPQNIPTVLDLCKSVQALGKTVWMWTGRKYEKVQDLEIMKYVDVLVDGPFVQSKKTTMRWCGSSNQRIIEIKPTFH